MSIAGCGKYRRKTGDEAMNRIRNLMLLAVVWGLLLSTVVSSVSVDAAVSRQGGAASAGSDVREDAARDHQRVQTPGDSKLTNQVAAWILWPLGLAEVWIVGWLSVWSAVLMIAPSVILKADVSMRKYSFGRLSLSGGRRLTLSHLTLVHAFAQHHRVADAWISCRMQAVSDWLSIGTSMADSNEDDLLMAVDGLTVTLNDAATIRALLPDRAFLLAIHGEGRRWREQVMDVLFRQAMHSESANRMLQHRSIPVVLDRNCVDRLRGIDARASTAPLWMRVLKNELCRIPGVRPHVDDGLLNCLVKTQRILPIADEWSRLPASLRNTLQSAVSTGELPGLIAIDDEGTVAEMNGVIRARSVGKIDASASFSTRPSQSSAGASQRMSPSRPSDHDADRRDRPAAPRRFDSGSVPLLVQSLDDPSAEVRQTAASALAKLGVGGSMAAKELAELLQDPVTSCRQAAADALGAIGHTEVSVIHALSQAAVNDHRMVRAAACRALGSIGRADRGAFEALVTALADDDPDVRAQAAESLGCAFVLAPETAAVLKKALNDQSAAVRRNAVAAISQIPDGPDEALAELITAIVDQSVEVRREVVTTLGKAGRARNLVARALAQALSDPDAETRSRAALSLSAFGEDARVAVPELARLAQDSVSEARRNAVKALGRIGILNLMTVSAIEEATRDADETVRLTAQSALERVMESSAAA